MKKDKLDKFESVQNELPSFGHSFSEMGIIPSNWQVVTMEDLFYFSGGFPASREQLSQEGFCYLHYGDIHKSLRTYVDVEENYEILPKLNIDVTRISQTSLLSDGDVVFVDASEDYEGVSKFLVIRNKSDIPYISGLHTIVAKSKSTQLLNDFKSYCFQNDLVRKQFNFYASGMKVYGLSKTNISKIKLLLPPLEEQLKLSNIFSVFDHIIELKEKLLNQKKIQKIGIIQIILRECFAKYKIKEIKDIADQRSEANKENLSIPVLSCTKYDGLVDSLEYFKRQVFAENLENYKIVRKNCFAYATNHIEEGSIGVQLKYEAGLVSPMYTVFELKKDMDEKFIFAILKTESYRRRYEMMMNASVNRRGSLRWNEFSKIKIPVPKYEDQVKMSKIIELASSEVRLLEKELELLKTQKKGLMQLLLTGKVRVSC